MVAILVASAGCLSASKSTDGPTKCPADGYEPNDTQETATDLGALKDDPDSSTGISSAVHLGSDTDWFRVHISDTGLGGDPVISVSVSQGFSVTTWFVCEGHQTKESQCVHGTSEPERVEGVEGCRGERVDQPLDSNGMTDPNANDDVATSTTDCEGTSSDDGTLFIRVQRPSFASETCAYDLAIGVE